MRLECKNEKLKAKNGFFAWPNMALLNPCFKDQIGLICEERTRREERRREEEKEEEKKKEGSSQDQAKRGMETHLEHEFYVIMYEFPCLVGW